MKRQLIPILAVLLFAAFLGGSPREAAGQLQPCDIAGAAVAVVREGKVLLAKGHGLANADLQKPALAETTLFTWTAVMQLAEQGRLDSNTS